MLLDLERRSIDLGTAAHEMIHQLAAESGFLPRHDAFPHWLNEGLAAQFEVIRGGRWSGISRAHDLRLPDWQTDSRPNPAGAPGQRRGIRARLSTRPLRTGRGACWFTTCVPGIRKSFSRSSICFAARIPEEPRTRPPRPVATGFPERSWREPSATTWTPSSTRLARPKHGNGENPARADTDRRMEKRSKRRPAFNDPPQKLMRPPRG